ncbi:MAG: hypothetical protein ACRENE_21865, partial [Polyangiaceae bacterium]
KMAVGMHMSNNADLTTPAIPNGPTSPQMIPDTVLPADPTSTTVPWPDATPVNQSCPNGVGFDGNNSLEIGTTNADSSNIDPTVGATNMFYANPNIPSGLAVPPAALRATFKIASWGAQPLGTPAPWTTISGLDSVSNISSTAYTPSLNNFFQQSCPTNTGTSSAPIVCGAALPSGSLNDQCMLVSLALPPGHLTGTPIGNASTYRNMHFGTLSNRTFPADITVKGLQALTGNTLPRDVYVNITLRNMPPIGNLPLFLDSTLMNLVKTAAIGLLSIVDPWSLSLASNAEMRMAWPTYEAHVFFDTGRINTIDGKAYHVLAPMNSFGYYLSHAGIFYGFTTAVKPDASNSPTTNSSWKPTDGTGRNFSVRIPNEGTFRLNSGVSADEVPAALVNLPQYLCQLFPWAC